MTEYEKINRRFEKFFFNRVKKTIDFKEVIAIIERSGIDAAVTYVTNDLANPELAREIERLYGVVGVRHANISTRALRILEKKGFGFNEEWVKFIQEYLRVHLIEKITFAVNATTRDFLLRVLQQSISEGWGVDKTVRELRESGFSDFQAARIVRTEVNTAANVGVIAAGQTYEYEMLKEWISINDRRTRGNNPKDHANHVALDGITIDFDDLFTDPRNGDKLRHPGDPKASAGSIINCRCNMGLKPKRDSRGRLIPKRRRNKPVLGFPNRPIPLEPEKQQFKPAETWEEAVRFMDTNALAYEMSGMAKAKLETLNAVNKVLFESKRDHGVVFDKVVFKKTAPKKFWIPGEHKLTFNQDGSLTETRLTIDQGHIDWANNKPGGFNGFVNKDNWLIAEDLEGMIHHEYGHLITMSRFTTKSEVLNWQKGVDKARIPISGYGKTHGVEALAEIWSLYKSKGKAALKQEWVDFFNTHSGNIKIKYESGSYRTTKSSLFNV